MYLVSLCGRDEACAEHVAVIHGREAGTLVAALLTCAARQPGGSRLDSRASAAVSVSAAAAALPQMRRSRPDLPVLTGAAAARVLGYCPALEISLTFDRVENVEGCYKITAATHLILKACNN